MRQLRNQPFKLIFLGALLCLAHTSKAEILHEEHSLYSRIIVNKIGNTVCLQFDLIIARISLPLHFFLYFMTD